MWIHSSRKTKLVYFSIKIAELFAKFSSQYEDEIRLALLIVSIYFDKQENKVASKSVKLNEIVIQTVATAVKTVDHVLKIDKTVRAMHATLSIPLSNENY